MKSPWASPNDPRIAEANAERILARTAHAQMTDWQLAETLVRAVDAYRPTQGEVPANYDAETEMFEAEDEICQRLGISSDETERGLTENATARIERFVSDALGKEWKYDLR